MEQVMSRISIPRYSMEEEVLNATTHGFGAVLSVVALVLMVLKASSPLAMVCACVFGVAMVVLYTTSCLYHALPATSTAKRIVRVMDHCNVFLLVFGTYVPAALLGVGGAMGWVLFGIVAFFTVVGIVFTAIDVDRFSVVQVICHLVNGWSILFGIPQLLSTMGLAGVAVIVAGGVAYSIGAILYGVGKSRPYMHSVFHVFCLLGTFLQFLGIYTFLL